MAERMDEKLKKIAREAYETSHLPNLYENIYAACEAVLREEPRHTTYTLCGKVAQTFIAREGSFFPCALEIGHEGPCLQSGNCFRHGIYFGKNCPHWPTCAALSSPLHQRAQTHDYLSTACFHGLHERCRQQCKFCGVKCNCTCGHPAAPLHQDAEPAVSHVSEDKPFSTFKCQSCGSQQWPMCPTCGAMMVPVEEYRAHAATLGRSQDVPAPSGVVESEDVIQQPSDGASLIATERARQIKVECWTSAHDDAHRNGSLAKAPECYLTCGHNQSRGVGQQKTLPLSWPWAKQWWKPSDDPVRNLVKAGALIAAEIDRLQRLQAHPQADKGERVTVEEVHTTPLNYSKNCAFTANLDGKPEGPLFSKREWAETFARGLRAELADASGAERGKK